MKYNIFFNVCVVLNQGTEKHKDLKLNLQKVVSLTHLIAEK